MSQIVKCAYSRCRLPKPMNLMVVRESRFFCCTRCFEGWKKEHQEADRVVVRMYHVIHVRD